jgi:multiple sugar transport system permease protein
MRRTHRLFHAPGETGAALLLAAPAFTGLVLFIAVPFLTAAALAFTDLRLGSPLPTAFVGLEQFRRLLHDPEFLRALLNNAVFAAVVVPVQTVLALAFALALNRPLRGMAAFRTLLFMPVVFPMSLVSVVWILLFAPGPDGMLNAVLGSLTLGAWEPVDFLRDPRFALPAIMLVSVWQGVGLQMVIILAGLQAIPVERYEAATIDGAGRFAQFLHVTLPGLRNTLTFVVLVTTVLAFRLFDQVRIMTRGGPERSTTTVIFEAVRTAFDRQQVALASAMTVVFFLIVLAVTVIQRRVVREEREIQ